jgi:Ca2+-binding RTX toxin-like protein
MRHLALSAAAITALSLSLVPIGSASAAPALCQGQAPTHFATANDTTVAGTAGADVISTDGFDRVTINGLAGDDTICLGDSVSPVVNAGDGADKVYAETSAQPKINGDAGDDTIADRTAGSDPLQGGTLSGGDGADTVSLTSRTTVATGGAGNDKLTVAAGVATDPASTTSPYPTVQPGAGDDTVDGGGTALLSFADAAGPINVDLTAGKATGDGTDTLTNVVNVVGSPAADTIVGTDTANDIRAGAGDTVDAKAGDDILTADGAKSILAGDGKDTITATSTPAVDAGGGDDTLVLTSSKALARSGNDTITATKSTVNAGAGDDAITQNGGSTDGAWGKDRIEVVNYGVAHGGPKADVLRASSDAAPEKAGTGGTRLRGDGGRDVVYVWAGARKKAGDRVNGGPGVDKVHLGKLEGGSVVDLASGRVVLRPTAASPKWKRVPARDFESIEGSRYNDRLYGNSAANHIDGNKGRDVLFGRAGSDRLHGGAGRDVIYGGSGFDRCTGEIRHSC